MKPAAPVTKSRIGGSSPSSESPQRVGEQRSTGGYSNRAKPGPYRRGLRNGLRISDEASGGCRLAAPTLPQTGPRRIRARMRKLLTVVLALAVVASITVGVVATEKPKPANAAFPTVPIMGPNVLSADQITAWFNSKHRTFAVPGISVRDLAQVFLSEGAAENVRGDIGFAQSIVETGYFGYVGSIVKPA